MPTGTTLQAQQRQYETTLIEYLTNEKGRIIALTDDQSFLSLLRALLIKQLAVNSPPSVLVDPALLSREIRESFKFYDSVVVFMEKMILGNSLIYLIRQLKEEYSAKVRIIALTTDLEKEEVMLLHEIGADNFVAKPVSTNTLIEKLAFTLKPQSKLGQLIDEAKLHLLEGKTDETFALVEQILEMKPNSAAGYLVKGDAHRKLGELDKARACYEEASSNAELYMEPLRRLSELYNEMGDAQNTLKYLELLDRLSPRNVERKLDMGELNLTLGNKEKAQDLFMAAVDQVAKEAQRGVSNLSDQIANLYAENNEPQMAEQFLRRCLDSKGKKLTRDDLATFNKLGINLRQQGRWQDALIEYQRALEIAPDDENIYYNMAMANVEGQRFTTARENILNALKINPDFPRASHGVAYKVGMVFVAAGSRDWGEKFLRIALELNPDFAAAKTALERLGQDKKDV